MKPAQDVVGSYELAFRQREFVRTVEKYDNRVLIARTLPFWPAAQNTRERLAVAEQEIPDNQPFQLLAEGYAAAFRK